MSAVENKLTSTNSREDSEENDDTSLPSAQKKRQSCRFGTKCFRQKATHRLHVAHPGDTDYAVPDMPEPNEDAAKCKYGRFCYRLNPEHFRNFTHPRNINIQQNYSKYVLKRQNNRRKSDSSFDYNTSDDDPFTGDSSGSDYLPSDEE